MRELEGRSAGHREAGAFLLSAASESDGRVRQVIFYDDVDAESLRGSIHLSSAAFSAVWQICRQEGLVVIGDVHTHPGPGVHQSHTDRANPIVARTGHVALIVPDFARNHPRIRDLGFHEYSTRGGWTSWFGNDVEQLVKIGLRPW